MYTIRLRSTDQTGYFVEEAFTIAITNVNEAPTAKNDAFSTLEDTPLSVALPGVLANDTDPEGDILSAVREASMALRTQAAFFTFGKADRARTSVTFREILEFRLPIQLVEQAHPEAVVPPERRRNILRDKN